MAWSQASSSAVAFACLLAILGTSAAAPTADPKYQTALFNVGPTITSRDEPLFAQPNTRGGLSLAATPATPESQFFQPVYPDGRKSPNLMYGFKLFSPSTGQYICTNRSSVVMESAALVDSGKAKCNATLVYDTLTRLQTTTGKCLSFAATTSSYPVNSPLFLAPCSLEANQRWIGLPRVAGDYKGTIQSLFRTKCLDASYSNLKVINCAQGLQKRMQTFTLMFRRDGASGTHFYYLYNEWAKKYIVFSNGRIGFSTDVVPNSPTASSEWTYNSRGQFRSAAGGDKINKFCLKIDDQDILGIDTLCANSNPSNRWLFSSLT